MYVYVIALRNAKRHLYNKDNKYISRIEKKCYKAFFSEILPFKVIPMGNIINVVLMYISLFILFRIGRNKKSFNT